MIVFGRPWRAGGADERRILGVGDQGARDAKRRKPDRPPGLVLVPALLAGDVMTVGRLIQRIGVVAVGPVP